MQLVHLASRLYGTPLLIARPKLDVILSVLGSRIGLPDLDMAMPLPMPRQNATSAQAGIAVIPVVGTLVRRSMGIEAASGLMSYGEIEARLDAALADPQVAGILLDLDSPGGEASGVFELAERIRAASTIKPIWAHANDAAYSAAFAIAAACQRLTLSQTAGVGSIGVIALHVDQSVKDAKDGLNYTAVFAGSHKNDFSPHEPLTPQATFALPPAAWTRRPSSHTCSQAAPVSDCPICTEIRVPGGVCLRAFSTRLRTARSNSTACPVSSSVSGATRAISPPRFHAACA